MGFLHDDLEGVPRELQVTELELPKQFDFTLDDAPSEIV